MLADLREGVEIRDAMQQGDALFARGDFSASLAKYQRVQALARETSPSDAASFKIALVYADPRNRERDNRKATEAFQGVIARHPESPWADQSRIWIAALGDLARVGREVEESKRELEKSRQALELSRREIEKSKHLLEQAKQEIEKLRQEIEKTKQALEKSRQVDIEIEKKRRIRGK